MRRAAGILFILVGGIMVAIYCFVMMRLPIPGFLVSRVGIVSLFVDRVRAPIWAAAFLTVGMLLLRRRLNQQRRFPDGS